jgi:hypothetical protein
MVAWRGIVLGEPGQRHEAFGSGNESEAADDLRLQHPRDQALNVLVMMSP